MKGFDGCQEGTGRQMLYYLQCFESGFRGLLDPDSASGSGPKGLKLQIVLRNSLDPEPDPDSDFWLDPDSMNMNPKNLLLGTGRG